MLCSQMRIGDHSWPMPFVTNAGSHGCHDVSRAGMSSKALIMVIIMITMRAPFPKRLKSNIRARLPSCFCILCLIDSCAAPAHPANRDQAEVCEFLFFPLVRAWRQGFLCDDVVGELGTLISLQNCCVWQTTKCSTSLEAWHTEAYIYTYERQM